MKKKWFLPGAVIILAGVGVLIFFNGRQGKKLNSITVTGIVEGTEVNLSSEIPGTIVEMCCREGDPVIEGTTVIKLRNDDLMSLLEQATAGVYRSEAEVKVAESAIESAKANIRSADADIKNAEAEMEKARVQMEDAKRQRDRLDALYRSEVISKESLDSAVTNYDAAIANLTSSKAKVMAAYSRRDASEAQLRTAESQLTAARAALRVSEANVSYSQSKLAYTTISSPISGTVIFKAFEKGETVSPGTTIVTIVDLKQLWVRVDIEETMTGNIILNKEAAIRSEGIPGKILRGRISEIGRYAEFATQRDVVRGSQDIRTFKVKIAVGDTSGKLKPGMTVDVEIPKEGSL